LFKKIFIITGESSGDKIGSLVIKKLKEKNLDIQFLAIGGENIKSEKIECIFDIKDIAYMGFIDVLKNIFSIKAKINLTVKKILEFNPDVIFSIDSPDFSFRILNKVKNINNKIKKIHLVAPQVWAWRENRKKILYKFIDHLLLLFPFEKMYFEGFVRNSFVGHPFFDFSVFKINKSENKDKKYFTLCPGSRNSELKTFMPIFVEVMKKINLNNNFLFHIPTSENNKNFINDYLKKSKIDNFIITTNENEKNFYIKDSILTISKSGTITLDICKNQCPLIVVYKTSWLNYLIIKPFVKTKYGNILNIIAQNEIIPELIQDKCNADEIYKLAKEFIENDLLRKNLVDDYTKILETIIVPDSLEKISNYITE
jgi:lipid-A-disaccharide synthase